VAARIAGWREDWAEAVILHARAEEQLKEIGLVLYDDDLQESRDLLDRARKQLGNEAFEARRAQGLDLTLPHAVEMADEILATT
jgi:hypothetical protein